MTQALTRTMAEKRITTYRELVDMKRVEEAEIRGFGWDVISTLRDGTIYPIQVMNELKTSMAMPSQFDKIGQGTIMNRVLSDLQRNHEFLFRKNDLEIVVYRNKPDSQVEDVGILGERVATLRFKAEETESKIVEPIRFDAKVLHVSDLLQAGLVGQEELQDIETNLQRIAEQAQQAADKYSTHYTKPDVTKYIHSYIKGSLHGAQLLSSGGPHFVLNDAEPGDNGENNYSKLQYLRMFLVSVQDRGHKPWWVQTPKITAGKAVVQDPLAVTTISFSETHVRTKLASILDGIGDNVLRWEAVTSADRIAKGYSAVIHEVKAALDNLLAINDGIDKMQTRLVQEVKKGGVDFRHATSYSEFIRGYRESSLALIRGDKGRGFHGIQGIVDRISGFADEKEVEATKQEQEAHESGKRPRGRTGNLREGTKEMIRQLVAAVRYVEEEVSQGLDRDTKRRQRASELVKQLDEKSMDI